MERVSQLGMVITIMLPCLFFVAESEVIDVTTLGAKPGPDMSPALMKAWDTACAATTPTKIVIPKGTFSLEEVILKGPCKSPGIEIQNDAVITGPEDPQQITKNNEWIMVENVEHLTISGSGTFDGKGAAKAWLQSDRCASVASCDRLANNFAFYFVNHSVVTGITTKDSKLFHMSVISCENFTISNIKVVAPQMSPNTDGIHIARSKSVKVMDSNVQTGDDCISLGDGNSNISISGITCGPGHGISIGSLGKTLKEDPITGVRVNNCTFINTDNGVRIKTWAGPGTHAMTVTDVVFEDLIMQNVTFPINIDQIYCPSGKCNLEPPSQVQITKVIFRNIKGTGGLPNVVKLICSKSNPCKEVEIGDINLTYNGPLGPAVTNCSNITPKFTGTQVPKICA